MKKLTIILAAILVLGSATIAAPSPVKNPTTEVTNAFAKNFSGAKNVNWREVGEVFFANFQMNNKEFFAAYSPKGELLGMSRTLELSQLPMAVTIQLQEQYSGLEIHNAVTEIVHEGQTSYYVTAEDSKKILKLKCLADGSVQVEEKIRKKKLVATAY
jgi:hypothetical protein